MKHHFKKVRLNAVKYVNVLSNVLCKKLFLKYVNVLYKKCDFAYIKYVKCISKYVNVLIFESTLISMLIPPPIGGVLLRTYYGVTYF